MAAQFNELNGALPTWSADALKTATDNCLSLMRHNGELQTEWQEFMKSRFEKDKHYPEKLATCRTPSDFVQMQFEFINDLYLDYAKEFQRMGEFMRETAATTLAPLAATPAGSNKPPMSKN